MKLQAKCKNCKELVDIKAQSYSRMDLENKVGTLFSVSCPSCLKRKEYHVNDVKAYNNSNFNVILIISLVSIAVFATTFLFTNGIIAIGTIALPIFIYILFANEQEKKIHLFNKNYIKRETPYSPKNPKRLS